MLKYLVIKAALEKVAATTHSTTARVGQRGNVETERERERERGIAREREKGVCQLKDKLLCKMFYMLL